MEYWFVKVVAKYMNCSTLSKELLPTVIMLFCPAFWCRGMTMYVLFSAFTSRPISLLATAKAFVFFFLRGGANKSLALSGRKQATATKLGIYSTNSKRSSIYFLARCSNFWKPLKKIQKVVPPIRSPRQQ